MFNMLFFERSRLIHQLAIILLALVYLTSSTPLEKRATQVSLINYSFSNNILSGSINVSLCHQLDPSLICEIDSEHRLHQSCPGCLCSWQQLDFFSKHICQLLCFWIGRIRDMDLLRNCNRSHTILHPI